MFVAAALVAIIIGYYAAPGPYYRLWISWQRWQAGFDQKTIIVEGLRWSYLDGGQGEPLLLLHGFGADQSHWLPVSVDLTDRYRVIVPDLPGFGDSASPTDIDYDIAAQSARVMAFANALGLKRLHLGGSSMGGYIALSLAHAHPDQIASLWLLGPAGLGSAEWSDMMVMIADSERNPLIPHTPKEFETTLAYVFAHPPFIPARMRVWLGQQQVQRSALNERIFADLRYRSPPLEDDIAGLITPALVMWGLRDRIMHPSGAEILATLLTDATVARYPDLGHLPMLEAPRLVASDYLAWRASQRPAEDTSMEDPSLQSIPP